MNEPDNLTGWVDKTGGTWVRVDDIPDRLIGGVTFPRWGHWWPRTDGPGFEPQAHDRIGQPRPWDQVEYVYAPLVPAPPELTAETIALVRLAALNGSWA